MVATVRELDTRTALAAVLARPHGDETLPVQGAIPAGLDGCFLQAGPHPSAAGQIASAGPHVFSGVRLEGGEARWYRAKMPVRRSEPLGPLPALAPSVWLMPRGSRGPDDPGHATVARPVREAGSGYWHTVASYPRLGYAEHLVAGPGGIVVDAEPFTLRDAPLMHAVGLTRRYVVVLDLPVTYCHATALVGARFPYVWRPDRQARIGLLPRQRRPGVAEPQWFTINPGYVFHTVNAYEDGSLVVLDAIWHPRDSSQPHLRRWTFDPATGGVVTRPVLGVQDVAIVDPRVSGRPHRHVFGLTAQQELIHHDLATGATLGRGLGARRRAGHPVFVPDPHDPAEGAGWLVVLTQDLARRQSTLLILDALDPTARPPAIIPLPSPLLPTPRSAWLPTPDRRGDPQLPS